MIPWCQLLSFLVRAIGSGESYVSCSLLLAQASRGYRNRRRLVFCYPLASRPSMVATFWVMAPVVPSRTSSLMTTLTRGATVAMWAVHALIRSSTSSREPSTLVNIAFVSLGSPDARTMRIISATAGPTEPSSATAAPPPGAIENAASAVTSTTLRAALAQHAVNFGAYAVVGCPAEQCNEVSRDFILCQNPRSWMWSVSLSSHDERREREPHSPMWRGRDPAERSLDAATWVARGSGGVPRDRSRLPKVEALVPGWGVLGTSPLGRGYSTDAYDHARAAGSVRAAVSAWSRSRGACW